MSGRGAWARGWRAAAAALLVAGGLASSGCSLLGLAIGSAADRHKPGQKPVPVRGICRLEKGQDVILTLRDGTDVTGKLYDCDPVASTVTVADADTARVVPLAEVEAVHAKVGKHGALTGLLVGVAIDAAVAVAFAASMESIGLGSGVSSY